MKNLQIDKTGFVLGEPELIRWPLPGVCFFPDTDREATKQFTGQSITGSLYMKSSVTMLTGAGLPGSVRPGALPVARNER